MNTATKNKYSYSTAMRKLILGQFGAAVLGIMLSVPTTNFANGALLDVCTSLLAIAFYLYIQYTAVWDIAAKDKLAIDAGRKEADTLIGLKAGLLANIPNFIIGGICLIFKCVAVFFDALWADKIAWIFNIIERLWHGMYAGIFVTVQTAVKGEAASALYMVIYLLATIPAILTCFVAYRMGLKGKRVFPEKKKN